MANFNKLLSLVVAFIICANTSIQAAEFSATKAYLEGLDLEKSKRYSAAFDKFQDNLRALPGDADTLREMGNCSYYLENYYDAQMFYEQYLRLRPNDKGIISALKYVQSSLSNAKTSVVVGQKLGLAEEMKKAEENERKKRAEKGEMSTAMKVITGISLVATCIFMAVLVEGFKRNPI